jgi:hypothetical protein
MPYPTSQADTAQPDKRSQKKDTTGTPPPMHEPKHACRRLRRFSCAFAQQVGLAVQCHDQTVDPVAPKDRVELRALYRQLADRAVEIDVGDLPRALVLVHQIIEGGRITVRLHNPGLDNDIRVVGPFAGNLQLLPRIAVELVNGGGKLGHMAAG